MLLKYITFVDMSKSVLIKSSLVKKYWMSFTGLFLCLFLIGHLLGNLQLLLPAEKAQLSFNEYAKFMTTFPLVKILSYLTYFSILFHAVDGILLTIQNRKARPVKYAYNKPSANSSWASRNMALLGFILLFFLVIHMKSFWYEMHFGNVPIDEAAFSELVAQGMSEEKALQEAPKDLYTITSKAFENIFYVLFYVVSLAAISLHLFHGLNSAFKSIGLSNPKYNNVLKFSAISFSLIVPLLFISIPITIYIRSIL